MKISRTLTASMICFGALALAGNTADAALISPVGATASSELASSLGAGNLIDNSGLSGSGITATQSSGAWLSADTGLPHTLIIDQCSVQPITDVHIWQYTHPSSNFSIDITIDFSTTGTGGSFGSPVDITMSGVTGTGSPAENFSLGSTINADAVRFTITSRQGGPGSYAGLGEVKFTTVPEPGSLALLGLGGLMMARRRR